MQARRIAIVGAGSGGLAAALLLTAQGHEVTVLEKEAGPGGKMRETDVGGQRIDAGPTVLTLRGIFEQLFEEAGSSLADAVTLEPATVLARHAWDGGGALDLYADADRSANAIGDFAGASAAHGFHNFRREAGEIFRVLAPSFILAQKPGLPQLMRRIGLHRLRDQWLINPYETLWGAVCRHFKDTRLRQLFARYSTYCGSSPFRTPATLMLIAHVEQQGVWLVKGGMHRLALAMMQAAQTQNAVFRFGADVSEVVVERGGARGVVLRGGERIAADAVIVNADASAVAKGLLGTSCSSSVRRVPRRAQSLSAVTWAMRATASGFVPGRHTVLFPQSPYRDEFKSIFNRGALPENPVVYICAQDRDSEGRLRQSEPERFFVVVNAPPHDPSNAYNTREIDQCERTTFALIRRCGLTLERSQDQIVRTDPASFAAMFPGTNGAIYGRASHGWRASFVRQGARCQIPGLYFAGGSVHPGAGVPMAALAGRLAAEALLADFVSMKRLYPAVTPGGILTPSAATAVTD